MPGDAEAEAAGDAAAAAAAAPGAGSREGSRLAGRLGPPSMRIRPGAAGGGLELVRRGGDRLGGALVDLGDLVGDARPGVALGALAPRLAHRGAALGLVPERQQLLAQRLRIGRRHQHAVDAVGDDVAVAGDRGGDRRRPRGHRLDQDHAEALARQRGRDEHVGLAERAPRAPRRRPCRAPRCARARRGRRSRARPRRARRRPRSASPGRARPGPGRRPAAPAGPCAPRRGRRTAAAAPRRAASGPVWRGLDVDAVGDDRVVAAEPAAAGPGGGLGDGDAGGELVEDAPRAQQRGDVVGHRLGRVGVEGADDGRAAEGGGVPGDQRRGRLVHVDHVVVARLAARGACARARPGTGRGSRRRRWRRTRSCGRAGPASRAARGPPGRSCAGDG